MATMVSVDLGAQSGRVAVGQLNGEQLEVSTVHRFPNVPVRTRGTLHWDVLRLFDGLLEGLRAAGREGRRVDSVGVDSWGVDFALLDRAGRLVQNPVCYRDTRRAEAMHGALAKVPARELYERTGIQLMPINTVFELAAMAAEDDPALEAAETLLMIPDLMHYWLGGSRVSEYTNATTTQCLDAQGGTWARDLLERLGVSSDLFPELVPPATVLAPLGSDVADETRLGAATVVAGATHDTAAAVAAIPLRGEESAFISAGTWSLVGTELSQPVIDDHSYAANLTNEGGVGCTVRLLRNVTGLWLLHECRRAWALEGDDRSFEQLVHLAETAPQLRSLIDPNDPLFAAPGDMPQKIREYCETTGQPRPADHGAFVRCVLESLALKHAQTLDLLQETTGVELREAHIVGGGAQNELLCRWTASASGLPVHVGPVEATEIGNLLVQAIALGELGSIDDARQVVRVSLAPTIHEPLDVPLWREARERFEDVSRSPRLLERIDP